MQVLRKVRVRAIVFQRFISGKPKLPNEEKIKRPKLFEMEKVVLTVVDNSNAYQKKTGNTEKSNPDKPDNEIGRFYQELLHRGRGVRSAFPFYIILLLLQLLSCILLSN